MHRLDLGLYSHLKVLGNRLRTHVNSTGKMVKIVQTGLKVWSSVILLYFFLGSNPACAGIFSGSSHTSDLNIGTPVATLPGAWHYRVSTGTGQPSVSIL